MGTSGGVNEGWGEGWEVRPGREREINISKLELLN